MELPGLPGFGGSGGGYDDWGDDDAYDDSDNEGGQVRPIIIPHARRILGASPYLCIISTPV